MKHYFKFVCGAAIPLLFTSCIDDNYDLSDIDTTSEFKVNDLVLPVNLDPVVLSDIIKVKEGDKLNEITVNGVKFYGVEQMGEFSSDGVDVNPFEADPDPMFDQTATFSLAPASALNGKRKASGTELYLLVNAVQEDLEYEASDIDGSIRELTAIYFNELSLKMSVSTSGLPSGINSQMSDISLTIPKGLAVSNVMASGEKIAYDYDIATGSLNLKEAFDLINNSTTIEIVTSSFDLSGYDNVFTYNPKTDSGRLDLKSVFNLENAKLTLSGETGTLSQINEVQYNVHYELGNIMATSIMGSICYDLSGTGLNIEPINLTNLPSFLNDPETNLSIANPQIYLNLKNPIGEYGLSYQSKLNIISKRESGERVFASPEVKVPGKTGSFNFLLAPDPKTVTNIPEDYASDISRLTYNDLGEILAGEGLPQMLDIDLVNPQIPQQKLSSPFQLGQSIEGMEGTYRFIAPLALKKGSKIVKTVDGWWSEDLSDLVIKKLAITADASSDIPMEVELHVYPIDKDGNRIDTTTETIVTLPALAKDAEISLEIIGNITNLDGIDIAVFAGSDDDEPLSPNQVITLTNLKAQVSGNYTRKL